MLTNRNRPAALNNRAQPCRAKYDRLTGADLTNLLAERPDNGNVTLGVGVLSYAGELGLGLVADAYAWPDLPVLVDAVRKLFEELIRST